MDRELDFRVLLEDLTEQIAVGDITFIESATNDERSRPGAQ
jgi:hypothetical protein